MRNTTYQNHRTKRAIGDEIHSTYPSTQRGLERSFRRQGIETARQQRKRAKVARRAAKCAT